MSLHLIELQIFEIGLLVFAAYMGGIIARKLRIGEVIGQILGGVIVGPNTLKLIDNFLVSHSYLSKYRILQPLYSFYNDSFQSFDSMYVAYQDTYSHMQFFTFLFLGLITFSLGEELHLERMKKIGWSAAIITLVQAFATVALITISFHYIFGFPVIIGLLLGSIGVATAPALSFILMNKFKIEGNLKNILANIIVLDDLTEVLLFSIFLGIAPFIITGGELSISHLTFHVVEEIAMALLVGAGIFFALKLTIKSNGSEDDEDYSEEGSSLSAVLSNHPTPSVEILFITIGIIAMGIATAIHYDLPFLLSSMFAGFLISNYHHQAIFDSLKIKNVMPIFNLMFFALIGASINLEQFSMQTLSFVLVYVLVRSVGKYFGTYLGCKFTGLDKKITATVPKLMLPQAELAAIETIIVANTLGNIPESQSLVATVVPALIIFQLGGAYLSERTLLRWKSWVTGEEKAYRSEIPVGKEMELKFLIEDRIVRLSPNSKTEAITMMANELKRKNIIADTDVVTNAIFEREMLATTGIGKGLALPHCRIASVDRVMVVLAYFDKAVDWNSLDNKAVDLAFMIITPQESPELHLQAISKISKAVKEINFREIIQGNSPDNYDELLGEMEGQSV